MSSNSLFDSLCFSSLQKCYQAPVTTKQHAVEARAEQCSKFDNTSFNGYFFTWVPYLGGETKTLTVFFFFFFFFNFYFKKIFKEENKCQTIAREVLLLK